MKKVRDLNRNRALDAASALWHLVVERNDVNSANWVCSFIEPAAFATWLLRHHQREKTTQSEAV